MMSDANIREQYISVKDLDLLFVAENKHKPNMDFNTFLQLLVKVAEYRYENTLPSREALERFIKEHMLPLYDNIYQHTDLGIEESSLKEPIKENVILILKAVHGPLLKIYTIYFPWEIRTSQEPHVAKQRTEQALFVLLKEFDVCPSIMTKGAAFMVWTEIMETPVRELSRNPRIENMVKNNSHRNMPPKGKKEGKSKKDAAKDLPDDELKQLPAFHKIFKDQVLKSAQNDEERTTIESAYSNSLEAENPHDDFNFALFDLEWALEKYESLFNAAKATYIASLAKKEEPPVKTEQKMEEEFNPNRAWGNYMDRSYYPNNYVQPQGNMYNPMTQSAPTRTPSYPGMEAYHNYGQDPSHMYMMQNQPQIAPNTMPGQYPVSTQGAYPTATTGYPQQVQPGFPQPTQAYPQPTQTAYPQMMAQPQIATQASPYMPATMQSPAHIQPTQPQPQPQPVNIQPQPQPHLQPPQTMQAQPATPQQPVAKAVPEKAEKAAALREQQYQTTTEFETNPNSQIGQDLNSVVPLNYNVMFNIFHKHNKKATDGFYNALYLSVADYVNNLLDELRNVCEMDNDAGDLKQYMKVGGAGHEADEQRNVLVGMDEGGEKKLTKHSQYLVRFSSVQDDQKQIEKIDDKEQKDLEDRYTMSKEDEEDKDKPSKKLKKDVTEEDEVIKFLFKTKKEKGQDNENTYKKTLEINQTLSNLTSRTYAAPKTAHMHDSSAAGANTGKGRKSTASQKRVTMKHMIYYLETNPMYKRTPLLHKAYLK